MTVTELKKSVRFKKLTEVYIDCEYAFSLYENELSLFGVSEGAVITEDVFEKILKKINKNAVNDALKMVARADQTKKLIEDKLLFKKYPKEIIEASVSYVCEKGFVDDVQYARDFVKASFKKGKGKRFVEFELKKRGIAEDVSDEIICEFYDEKSILEVAEAKLNSIIKNKEVPEYKDFLKLRDYLIRQGFGYDEISEALNNMKGKFYD